MGPNRGDMACGETGFGRMAEPDEIVEAVRQLLNPPERPLKGLRALVTSGPTAEAIDPVRFLTNHSSGKQGHAVAAALRQAGAEVTLVTGPVAEPDPRDVDIVNVMSAIEMLEACQQTLPVDIAVCVAAVSDWRPADRQGQKIKKQEDEPPPVIDLVENPDILKTLSHPGQNRPELVIGFAAETEHVERNARRKLVTKGCDWIVANNVSAEQNTFGNVDNTVQLFRGEESSEDWPRLTKVAVAERLVQRIIEHFDERRDAVSEVRS